MQKDYNFFHNKSTQVISKKSRINNFLIRFLIFSFVFSVFLFTPKIMSILSKNIVEVVSINTNDLKDFYQKNFNEKNQIALNEQNVDAYTEQLKAQLLMLQIENQFLKTKEASQTQLSTSEVEEYQKAVQMALINLDDLKKISENEIYKIKKEQIIKK